MPSLTIYHNPRCSKSREALRWIENRNIDVRVIKYMSEGLTKKDLTDILKKLNLDVEDIIRTREKLYKDNYKGQNLSHSQWLDVICEEPRLLQRPIVILGNHAVIARPADRIDEML